MIIFIAVNFSSFLCFRTYMRYNYLDPLVALERKLISHLPKGVDKVSVYFPYFTILHRNDD